MTKEQAEKMYMALNPRLLVCGVEDKKNGEWGVVNKVCETKTELFDCIKNLSTFKVYFLKLSDIGCESFRVESLKYTASVAHQESINNTKK